MIPLMIRRYRPSDQDVIRELHRTGLQQQGVYAGDDYYAELDQIEQHYIQQGGDFLLMFHHDQLVGMGAWKPIKSETVQLTSFSVRKDQQGKGLGTLLVKLCLTQAKQAGYQYAQLRTSIKQCAAIRLYERIGFQLYQKTTDPIIDQRLQAQNILQSKQSLPLLNYQLDLIKFYDSKQALALLQDENFNYGIAYNHQIKSRED